MKKKVFCLPYAGGSATAIYSKWKSHLSQDIHLIPVELPGRGALMDKPAFQSIDETVDHLVGRMADELEECDYILWGHSLGGYIVYELAKKIETLNMRKPKKLLITGKKPLHIPREDQPIHDLPDEDFIEEVVALNGTPRHVFDDESIRRLFLPILRADFKCVHDYRFRDDYIVETPIIAIMGSEEDIQDHEKERWKELTKTTCDVLTMSGNHFFINDNVAELSHVIHSMLA